jgi:hypothetical protein
MSTAILLFILIVIDIAIFCLGVAVGSWATGRKLMDAMSKALDESDLTSEQKIHLLETMQSETKK